MHAAFSNRVRRAGPVDAFTLIEMVILIVIVGLLATIALPNFLRYQLQAKTAEASTNLHGIMVAEEAYASEFGAFIDAAASPAHYGGRAQVPFSDSGPPGSNFAELGWKPSGLVHFQYSVTVSEGAYTAEAAGDIDGNGTPQLWGFVRPDDFDGVIEGRLGCRGVWDPATHEANARKAVGPCGSNFGRSEF